MAVIFEDNFNRSELGDSWLVPSPGAGISSNKLQFYKNTGNRWPHAFAGTPFTNAELLFKLELELDASTTTGYVYLKTAQTDQLSGENTTTSVWLKLAPNSGVALYKTVAGSSTKLADYPSWDTDNESYWIRVQFDGPNFRFKYWSVSVSEPASWTYEGTHTTFEGYFGAGIHSTSGSGTDFMWLDDVLIQSLAEPAEVSAGGFSGEAELVAPTVEAAVHAGETATAFEASASMSGPEIETSIVWYTDFSDYDPGEWGTYAFEDHYYQVDSSGVYSGVLRRIGFDNSESRHWRIAETSANIEVLALLYSSNSNWSFQRLGVLLHESGGAGRYEVYRLANTLVIRRSGYDVASTSVSSVGTNPFFIRVRIEDGVLYVRTWRSSVAEPSSWDLQYADPDPLPAGYYGVAEQSAGRGRWEYLAAALNGLPAPMPPQSAEATASVLTGSGSMPAATAAPGVVAEVEAAVFEAGAELVQPTVQTGTGAVVEPVAFSAAGVFEAPVLEIGKTVTAAPMLGTATLLEADVPSVTIFAVVHTGMASLLQPTVEIPHPAEVSAGVLEGSAAMPMPVFDNTKTAEPAVAAMHAMGEFLAPYSVDFDDYYQYMQSLRGYFYPLDEEAGPYVYRTHPDFDGTPNPGWLDEGFKLPAGEYIGTPEFRVDAPLGRKAVRLDASDRIELGSSYTRPSQHHPWTFNRLEYGMQTLEFSFRTTVATQPFMRGSYNLQTVIGKGGITIDMRDGYLRMYTDGGHTVNVLKRRVDDGNWHHVVFNFNEGGGNSAAYLDGQPVRKLPGVGSIDNLPFIDRVEGYTGELSGLFMSDEQLHPQPELADHEAVQRYYLWASANVVEAVPMLGSFSMPDAVGRGSFKRILALYTTDGTTTTFGTSGSVTNPIRYYVKDIGWLPSWTGYNWEDLTASRGGFIVEYRNIGGGDWSPAELARGVNTEWPYQSYVDDFGNSRLIDLAEDLDMSRYEAFYFVHELDPGTPFSARRRSFEALMDSVRTAIDSGVKFWCWQPEMAVALGFAEQVLSHDRMHDGTGPQGDWPAYDPGRLYFQFDAKSALIAASYGESGSRIIPQYYYDTHWLNKYRVVGQLPGFTDYGGWTRDDMVFWRDIYDWLSKDADFYAYRHRFLGDNLDVGEELYVRDPADNFDNRQHADIDEERRLKTWFGVPPGKWYAGTAMAKGQRKVFHRYEELDNPYAEWVHSIALQPGDTVKGRPIGAKVIVDFMHKPEFVSKELVLQGGNAWYQDTSSRPADASVHYWGWDYDSRRTKRRTTLTSYIRIIAEGVSQSMDIPVYHEEELFPIKSRGPSWGWITRINRWLLHSDEDSDWVPGEARVYASTMRGSGRVAGAAYGTKPADVLAGVASGYGTLLPGKTDEDISVDVYATRMRASGMMPRLTNSVYVQSLYGMGSLLMPQVESSALKDEVVFTVPTRSLVFYLTEDL